MEFVVLSAERARSYEPSGTEICISITDPNADLVVLSPRFADVLRLSFTDIAGPSPYAWDRLFSADDARRILQFVGAHTEARRLVVHCTAGLSRSPAVALALAELWGHDCADLEQRYPLWNSWVRAELLRLGAPQTGPREDDGAVATEPGGG
jgi:predicted protein tyrosine phosphatase